MRRKLAAGNWKMNGLGGDLAELSALPRPEHVDVLICPPATLIHAAAAQAAGLAIGAQDCHAEASGAYTGDLAAPMLRDAGASHVILGHSERRAAYGESDEQVQAKARAAQNTGLTAIVCLGETAAQRSAGTTLDVVGSQLAGSVPDGSSGSNLVIAYEPIWAIGTGEVPTCAEIQDVHDFLRARLTERFGAGMADAVRLLYGGSVKPDNAADIFATPNVDGALVGGASLKAADFGPIIDVLALA